MQEEEKPGVHAIMRRSFPLIARLFFTWTPNVLVAERDGQLLGATMLKLFPLPGGQKGGLVSGIFTDPSARGQGAGQKLTEAALKFFDEQGCDEVIAAVEGYNTSSSKLFATRGFSILSPGEQFRRYGLKTFIVWARIFHYLDIGHFVWARPGAKRPGSSALQLWGTILTNIAIALLALWQWHGAGFFSDVPISFLAVPLVVTLFLGTRTLGMALAARSQGLAVRYRAWESGFVLSIAIALLGGYFPMPGGVYPASDKWRYRDLLPKLAIMALAGILPVLTLTWIVWALRQFGILPPGITPWIDIAIMIGLPLALFDTVLPFFPFVSFNGRRLWDWNRAVWAVLAVVVVLLWIL
ncbi:MAG: GNAT family N-acetyltransferase [Actinobacteria bacterium]|nr:GNAT family N-acetyltransferase [Actinomycetota bacterium]